MKYSSDYWLDINNAQNSKPQRIATSSILHQILPLEYTERGQRKIYQMLQIN